MRRIDPTPRQREALENFKAVVKENLRTTSDIVDLDTIFHQLEWGGYLNLAKGDFDSLRYLSKQLHYA